MGVMKDLHTTIRNGGDEAVAAVQRMGEDWLAQLEQAAAEIERLRGYRDEAESDAAVARLLVDKLRLTDAEREAIEWCRDNITAMACPSSAFAYIHASSLRGLLARCAIGHQ